MNKTMQFKISQSDLFINKMFRHLCMLQCYMSLNNNRNTIANACIGKSEIKTFPYGGIFFGIFNGRQFFFSLHHLFIHCNIFSIYLFNSIGLVFFLFTHIQDERQKLQQNYANNTQVATHMAFQ